MSSSFAGKSVVIVSSGIPHPTRGASTVLYYYYIESIVRSGATIDHYLILNDDHSEDEVQEYRQRFKDDSNYRLHTFRATILVHQNKINFWMDPAVPTWIEQNASQKTFDGLFCLDIASAWAANSIEAKYKLIWLGDLNFQTHWYHAWYGVKEGAIRGLHGVRHLVASFLRCQNWRKIYKQVLGHFDHVIVSSKSSEKQLDRLGVKSIYHPYPWPHIPESNLISPVTLNKPRFLFFGNLAALGSRSALHFMTDELYPRMKKIWGEQGFEFRLAGFMKSPEWFTDSIADKPEFRVLGFVDDLYQEIHQNHAVVIPIDVPVGNRSRILTALSAGAVVVAHRNTTLANPELMDSKNCLLASDPDEFVWKMKSIVEGTHDVSGLPAQARACYQQHFSPPNACRLLMDDLSQGLL